MTSEMSSVNPDEVLYLPPGWRVTIAGRTGTGKTTLAVKYLAASRYHWLIFNPKWTAAYDRLAPERLRRVTEGNLASALRRSQYVSLDFGDGWGWQEMDDLLRWLTGRYENIGLCIDEAYTLHNSGRAGPGLMGLLTRGRELRQSALLLTQRPVWVSPFCFSEADAVIEFRLSRADDRKRIVEATGYDAAMVAPRGHDFLFLPVASERPILYRAAA